VSYRHRSAFLPFAITAAAFIAAAIAHPQHRRVWLMVALVTALVAILAAIPHRLSWASSRPGRARWLRTAIPR
jgi:hypothetical protein